MFANEMLVSLITWINSHGGITEHSLGTGCCNDYHLIGIDYGVA